jgi:hypothetical protein
MNNIEVKLTIPPELLAQFNASLDKLISVTQLAGSTSLPSVAPFDKSIFISYRRSDSAYITGRIYDHLAAAFGETNVFRDIDNILAGRDFTEQLDKELQNADVMLVIIGTDWLDVRDAQTGERRLDNENDIVRLEVEIGLERNIPIIPVLVRGASVPDKASLPFRLKPLADKSGLSVDPDPDFHDDVERLIEQIKRTLGV